MQKDEDGGAELRCEESPMNLCLTNEKIKWKTCYVSDRDFRVKITRWY